MTTDGDDAARIAELLRLVLELNPIDREPLPAPTDDRGPAQTPCFPGGGADPRFLHEPVSRSLLARALADFLARQGRPGRPLH